MLLMLLACYAGEIERLEGEIDDLQEEVVELEGQIAGADTAAPSDSEADTPTPGDVFVDAAYDSGPRIWTVSVELSEPGEGVLIGSYVNYDSVELPLTGTCTTAQIDEEWGGYVTFTVEVEWASGAWSCVEVLGPDAQPSTRCEAVKVRPVEC